MTDYTKCAFIDAWQLPHAYRTKKELKDKYEKFPEDVFISYIDESGNTKIEKFKPVYEYYIPLNNYYAKKDYYNDLLEKNPNWIEEFNATAEEKEKLYLGIDNVVCEKKVCDTYKEFDSQVHGYRPVQEIPQTARSKYVKNKEVRSEYGSSVSHMLKNIEMVNKLRVNSNLYAYKVKWLLYESTHNVEFKTIRRYFSSDDKKVVLKQPNLKVCFFDIEVDVRMDSEFPDPKKALLPINCISMYNAWEDRNVTIALAPNRTFENIAPMTLEEAKNACADLPDTIVVQTEEELLNLMLQNFEKADVISGYNSELFDLPYIINRVKKVLGSTATYRLNMINTEPIPITKRTRTGQKYDTFKLVGRVHIDYLVLYKHHNPKQQPSYKLDFIGKLETGEGKEEYEGNLEQLYHRDFRKFVDYNRQDAALLKKIDDKVKFIELTNALAHTHGVTMDAMLGTVSWDDQWQINNAHSKGRICPDKILMKEDYEKNLERQRHITEYLKGIIEFHPDSPHSPYFDWSFASPPGAWCNMPVHGVRFNMASYDINSLYPSIMRSIHVGIEAIIGRIRQTYTIEYMKNKCITKKLYGKVKEKIPDYTKLWEHEWAVQEMKKIWAKTDDLITIDFEDGKTEERTAAEWYKIIFEDMQGKWCISANGTIFDAVHQPITAYTMETGYAERKGFQKIMRAYDSMHDGANVSEELEAQLVDLSSYQKHEPHYKETHTIAGNEYETPYMFDYEKLNQLVSDNSIEELKQFMVDNDLIVKNHKIISKNDDEITKKSAYWNLHQKIRKICLNSTYGALLTPGSKWYDIDQGKSITLTGQNITKHMTSFVIQEMTGDYDYLNDGVCIGDTDSCYISISKAFETKGKPYNMSVEELVEYADKVGDAVNASFPEFMHRTFGVDLEHGGIIKAGRENVFYSCQCCVKKHYAGLVVNADGHQIFSRVGISISDEEIKKKYLDLGIINGKHYVHLNGKGIVYKEQDKQYYAIGKLKITGLDELRSDVSLEVKGLLRKILCVILLGGTKNQVEDLLIDHHNDLMKKLPWEKGMPKSCKNVSEWEEKIGILNSNYKPEQVKELTNDGKDDGESEYIGKVNVPATASACINWNRLRVLNNDMQSPQLMNGHRLIFLKVKHPNKYNIKNIGLPYDISVIPEWFKELPFDEDSMIESILMKKVSNLTDPLGWKFNLNKNAWSEQFGDDVDYE